MKLAVKYFELVKRRDDCIKADLKVQIKRLIKKDVETYFVFPVTFWAQSDVVSTASDYTSCNQMLPKMSGNRVCVSTKVDYCDNYQQKLLYIDLISRNTGQSQNLLAPFAALRFCIFFSTNLLLGRLTYRLKFWRQCWTKTSTVGIVSISHSQVRCLWWFFVASLSENEKPDKTFSSKNDSIEGM